VIGGECLACGEHKANEKFSGKGHAVHICKACAKLSVAQRNELQRMNRIAEIGMRFSIPKDKLGLLKKYASDKRYPEAAQFAKDMLDGFNERSNNRETDCREDDLFEETVTFDELGSDDRETLRGDIEGIIREFISDAGYIPGKRTG
jgi:hypothetical protein